MLDKPENKKIFKKLDSKSLDPIKEESLSENSIDNSLCSDNSSLESSNKESINPFTEPTTENIIPLTESNIKNLRKETNDSNCSLEIPIENGSPKYNESIFGDAPNGG
jgi:hypothetical protein